MTNCHLAIDTVGLQVYILDEVCMLQICMCYDSSSNTEKFHNEPLSNDNDVAGGDAQEITVQPEDEYSWHVEEEWINSIRSGAPVRRTDFTSGVRYMEFTEAVSLSLQQQRTIHLPLLK